MHKELFIIETNFPKQSPNISFKGELETIVLDQIKKLGIGVFPNDKTTPKAFALELMHLIRRSRSRSFQIKTQDIFKDLNIQTDYGSIEQVFPIDNQKNIKAKYAIKEFPTGYDTSRKTGRMEDVINSQQWPRNRHISYSQIVRKCEPKPSPPFSKGIPQNPG